VGASDPSWLSWDWRDEDRFLPQEEKPKTGDDIVQYCGSKAVLRRSACDVG